VKPSRLFRSSSFRLALVYMCLFAVSVLILLGFLYWATAGYMARQADDAIASEIRGLEEQYRQRGATGLARTIRDRIAQDPTRAAVYLLTDPAFVPIVGNLDRWPSAKPDSDGWITFQLRDRAVDEGRAYDARARAFVLAGDLHLLVGRDVRELERTRELIIQALIWGLAITAALALVGGTMMSWSTVRRIDAINQASREIMTGDLSQRIPTKGTGDDFDRLAEGLNSMLDQIELLMEGVRSVSDNIAHDLRTPLTRLRGQLEMLQGLEPGSEEHKALVDRSVGEADSLLTTFSALLRIAQIEAGSRRANFVEVDLTALLQDVADYYAPLAHDKEQALETALAREVSVRGDRDLLFQAFANVVDNAIKYTPTGGRIRLFLSRRDEGGPEAIVSDSGPGVPEDEKERIWERFYRADQARASPGSGLGLSLVAAVARLHGADIAAEDNRPGLRVVWRFAADGGAS
jgi:signal transduction histidine kinase